MGSPEQGKNQVDSSALVEQERGALSKWLASRVGLLVGGMFLLAGGIAEAQNSKAQTTKEKPAVTSVEKKDNGVDVLKSRTKKFEDMKFHVEGFRYESTDEVYDALLKQGVKMQGNFIVLKSGQRMALNGEVNGSKTLEAKLKVLQDGSVEVVTLNSDKSKDIAIIAGGKVTSMNNIAPAK